MEASTERVGTLWRVLLLLYYGALVNKRKLIDWKDCNKFSFETLHTILRFGCHKYSQDESVVCREKFYSWAISWFRSILSYEVLILKKFF